MLSHFAGWCEEAPTLERCSAFIAKRSVRQALLTGPSNIWTSLETPTVAENMEELSVPEPKEFEVEVSGEGRALFDEGVGRGGEAKPARQEG